MRSLLRFVCIALIVLGGWVTPAWHAYAANLDPTADRVFGQPDFISNASNNGGVSANSLNYPRGVAMDTQGNLYVADTENHRVLEYDAPLTAGATADRVIGQPDFTSHTANNGGVSANSLSSPFGLAIDAQGNLYVADTNNHRVLEYTAPLSTGMAASRVFGQAGSFTTAVPNNGGISDDSLNNPNGLVVDAQGNLYVTDTNNNRLLEYDTPLTDADDVTADRVFGQPDFTSNAANNGGVSANSLYYPWGVAVDVQVNLYVADALNNRVLEYDTPLTGDVTADHVFGQPDFTSHTANNGGVGAHSLFIPDGIAVDTQGNLYVVDSNNYRVLEYDTPLTANTTADRVFGQPDFTSHTANNGGVSANSLNYLNGVAVDVQSNLYVADTYNHRVLEYDVPVPYGVPSLAALSPSTVAVGSPAFTLTVNGYGFVPGSMVRWNGGNRPTAFLSSTQLNASISAADLASGGPFAVTVFTPAPGGGTSALLNLTTYTRLGQDATADLVLGQPNFQANTRNNTLLPGGANRLWDPVGVAVDSHTGRLFVADMVNNRVLSWPDASALVNGQAADLVIGQPDFTSHTANNGGVSANSLSSPFGLAVDAQGNLYVADFFNSRVLEYDTPLTDDVTADRVFGQPDFTSNAPNNGGVSANSLSDPCGVVVDAQGNLYVADTYNRRVLEYDAPLTAGATADRVIGQPDFTSNVANNGGVSANSLSDPSGLVVDTQGNLYVADTNNHRVLEYTAPLSTGMAASRVFGQAGNFTTAVPNNGGVSANSLSDPCGLVVDTQGNLYVADYFNSRVLEYDTPLTDDVTADRVFGQPDFTSRTSNNGGISANSLSFPQGVAVDVQGNLIVADSNNQRVLEYDRPMPLLKVFLPLLLR